MSITQKLVILFLTISLVPLIILSLLVYTTLTKEITATANVALTRVADKQKVNITNILEADNATTISFATLYDLRQTFADYLIKKDQQNITKLIGTVNSAKATGADVVDVTLADLHGQVVASTNQKLLTTNIKNQPYFNNTNKVTIINNTEDSTPKLYFEREITSDEKVLGYIFVTFTTYRINGVLQDYTGLGDTGQTILAQKYKKSSIIIIAPYRFNKEATFNALIYKQPLSSITEAFYPNLIDQNGHAVVAVTRVIPQTGWEMIVTMDIAEILAPINPVRDIILLILLLSSIIVTILALYFARLFTAPIITIATVANRISEGDFRQKIEITSSDELGTLASEFNNMAAQLSQSYQALEQKVTDRTGQLSEKVNDLEKAKKDMTNVMGALQIEKMKIDEQKNVLKSILDNLPVGVSLSLAPSGRVVNINKIGIGLLGNTLDMSEMKENMINVNAMMNVDDSPYPINDNPLANALKQGRASMKDDLYVHNAEGTKICIRATCVPIKNVQGEMVSVVSVFEDVTKEKHVDRMKTEFISLASHQLRTPLSAIRWFTDMLLDGDAGQLNPEQTDFAKNVSESTQRMIELVNSLLNISRIESGRILIDPKPTDLKELVQGVVTDLKAKIEERKQNLVISVHEGLPKVNLDPKLIRQVYMNLLTNAVKYTQKEGEISVIISKKDDEIIAQISDNGYGIPKAQQNKVFEKFFRGENVSKIETDGTGLGLYLIKAIIESSNGKIWFTSEEGKGTSFWFSLPMSGMIAKKGEVTLD